MRAKLGTTFPIPLRASPRSPQVWIVPAKGSVYSALVQQTCCITHSVFGRSSLLDTSPKIAYESERIRDGLRASSSPTRLEVDAEQVVVDATHASARCRQGGEIAHSLRRVFARMGNAGCVDAVLLLAS
jgi:hypothetical protein